MVLQLCPLGEIIGLNQENIMPEKVETKAQFTKLLSNKTLGRIERLRLNSMCRLTSHYRGEHLSGRGGSSMEFADYRDYSPGDDIRFIDWNIFSRLNRPYLKLFCMEEEMHLVIITDASESMAFDGKFEMAQKLAAAFGVMGLFGNERVSSWYPNNNPDFTGSDNFPSCHGRAKLQQFLRFTDSAKTGGALSFDNAVDHVLKHHKGKGIVVLLSDFFTFGNIARNMNALLSSGLEIMGIQILSPAELNPELTSDARFVDSETESNLDVSSGGDLLSIYHDHRKKHTENLEKLCKQRSGRFLLVSSDMKIETILFDIMQRSGWIK